MELLSMTRWDSPSGTYTMYNPGDFNLNLMTEVIENFLEKGERKIVLMTGSGGMKELESVLVKEMLKSNDSSRFPSSEPEILF